MIFGIVLTFPWPARYFFYKYSMCNYALRQLAI